MVDAWSESGDAVEADERMSGRERLTANLRDKIGTDSLDQLGDAWDRHSKSRNELEIKQHKVITAVYLCLPRNSLKVS